MGKIFEDICKQYLWKQLLSGKCPVEFASLGRWWGNDPIENCQAEIDIMGEQDKDTALFAECKLAAERKISLPPVHISCLLIPYKKSVR